MKKDFLLVETIQNNTIKLINTIYQDSSEDDSRICCTNRELDELGQGEIRKALLFKCPVYIPPFHRESKKLFTEIKKSNL